MMSSVMPRSTEHVFAAPANGSAFAAPGLGELLTREGIRRITLVGVETHTAVLLTAADAVARGYAVVVPETCVCAGDRRSHEAALHLIRTSWSKPQQVAAVADDGAGVRL
jgi:nicotinamidase-related amidase